MITVISPHADDAIFSVAEWLLCQQEPITIVTVFARRMEHDAEWFDTLMGEHHDVMRHLGWAWLDLDFPDGKYLTAPPSYDIANEIWLACVGSSVVLYPLGIHHSDHLLVNAACQAIDRPYGVYEELPYRVLYPAGLPRRGRLDGAGGKLERKRELVRMYASQVNDDLERCVYAPERIWWRQ